MKFREIKLGEREGMHTVNGFYRERNGESLNWYKEMMNA